jgi:hypothetical protein
MVVQRCLWKSRVGTHVRNGETKAGQNIIRWTVLRSVSFLGIHPPSSRDMIVVSFHEDLDMQRFEYRHPRLPVDLSAEFSIANETLAGRCINISTKGMGIDLLDRIEPGYCGVVSLRYMNQTIDLNVRVAHTGRKHCGFEFRCDSGAEQRTLTHLITALMDPRNRHQLSLVPRIEDQ